MSDQAVFDEYCSAQIAFTSAGDTVVLPFLHPVDIYRWALALNALLDVGAGFSISIDKRVTLGSDTNRVANILGTYTTTVDVAAGTVVWFDPVQGGAWAAPYALDSSEGLVIDVDDAADTAGTGYVIIQYRRRPYVGSRGPGKTLTVAGTLV